VLTAFGSSRVMFGSDWPVCLLAADYAQVKRILENYIIGFSRSEVGMIMGGNARTFYKL
jgi:L-fuconolactonase